MDELSLTSLYEESPENGADWASEDQLLVKIEEQFQVSENNFHKVDLLEIYLRDLVGIDLNDVEPYQVEMKISNDDQKEVFDYLMTQLKFLFNKYFGIDSTDLELDVADFEFIYYLYDMFVLRLNHTMTNFLNGLRSKSNNFVSNPDNYTLHGGYKEYLSKINPIPVLSQESLSLESIREIDKGITEITNEDVEGLKVYTQSSQSFLDLCNRSIMDDALLDIDCFFDILCLSDENNIYLKFATIVADGTIPFDVFMFRTRIRTEVFLPENLDDIETRYRELIEVQI